MKARARPVRRARGRLRAVGLRWRLAGWVAAAIVICLGVAFLAVYQETGTDVRGEIDKELAGDASEFAHGLASTSAHSDAQLAQAAARYVRAQPFAESSTLLFAVIPGEETPTNSPDLFQARAPDDGESKTEQAEENRLSTRLLTARSGYSTLPVPDVGSLRVFKERIVVGGAGGAHTLVVGVGEPVAAVVRAQRGVASAFIVGGLLALAGALLGAYLIGTRVSRPLRRMAAVAARVDAGDLAPRIASGAGESREIGVLADAFNHMLDRLTDAFAGQRAFVADASHELRTPLTIIRGQLEVLASHESPSAAEVRRVERLVQDEIARISRLVDDLLVLAKSEQPRFLRLEKIDLPAFVGELWQRSTLQVDRSFELGELPPGALSADPDRLAQALRNLLSNAIAHTSAGAGTVRLSVESLEGERVRFVVEDDGPGIPPEQRDRVFERFHRVDQARDRASGGTGLGLAIVAAIAAAHGGRARVRNSPLGGALVELELPGFHAARGRPRRPGETAGRANASLTGI